MSAYLDVPTAHTPAGGYGTSMPEPILGGCTDPLAADAPDFRGTWRALEVRAEDGAPLPDDHQIRRHVERIEQAGNRVVITAAGIIHDMYVDGTYDNGVNDVAAIDFTTPVVVAAFFEDGALVLRPQGMPGVEIRRWLDGEHLMWRYHTAFTARLERT
jgi:hypothetical protein